MPSHPSTVEQAVARALRDNLNRIQRTAEELHEAVADFVAACSSSRPTNALPPMLRAQTAAASLAASLEVLTRFITAALQPAERTPAEKELLRLVSIPAPEPPPSAPPPSRIPTPMAVVDEPSPAASEVAPVEVEEVAPTAEVESSPEVPAPVEVWQEAEMVGESATEVAPEMIDSAAEQAVEPEPVVETPPLERPVTKAVREPRRVFDVSNLPVEEQELHRRANRVAKVSMQDIKMLRPEQVRLGREHKDLCVRLRDEIEKAHKEYSRRFRPILDHPMDYFYHWMVEILADGDPEALGEYPYSSPVLRR
ncbi:MAG TPA: hypothetical protein VKE24_15240 [Candidatus Acidoferrales bacterium]|nr:hypothetical protein [Candidatus Acidoferrales bacterium]